MTALLKTSRLKKAFGGLQAIDALDLEVECDEILGIIGPNGAGKTTLINLITGFLRPDSGVIEFNGKNITSAGSDKVARHGIARTFQIVRPFANISVLDNVVIGRLYGKEPARTMKQARSEAEDLLHFVGLDGKSRIKACNLTLADRRKLELARALAARPRLLLLDEVIAGLNPVETEMAVQIIKKIQALDVAIAFVEHVMKVVVELSTRVIVLDAGQKIAEGAPQEVMNNPLVIQSYLGEEV
jgi:ABC-type branched-subunit amino acid transport system ATPase component